jgi:hypothetical protein
MGTTALDYEVMKQMGVSEEDFRKYYKPEGMTAMNQSCQAGSRVGGSTTRRAITETMVASPRPLLPLGYEIMKMGISERDYEIMKRNLSRMVS